jgi:phosphopantetheinyl transferase (holo-ACP synthase)
LDEHRLEQLKTFPERVQQKQFLRFWTLHEAFAKADGRGVAHKSDNNLSPSKVWDLIFEAKNFLSAFSRSNRTWNQQVDRVGGNTAIVSATLPDPRRKERSLRLRRLRTDNERAKVQLSADKHEESAKR